MSATLGFLFETSFLRVAVEGLGFLKRFLRASFWLYLGAMLAPSWGIFGPCFQVEQHFGLKLEVKLALQLHFAELSKTKNQ